MCSTNHLSLNAKLSPLAITLRTVESFSAYPGAWSLSVAPVTLSTASSDGKGDS